MKILHSKDTALMKTIKLFSIQAPQAAFIHDIDVHIKINCKTITEVVVPVVLVLGVLIVSVTYSGSWAATQTHVKSTSLSKFA